jgi:hypothetical protein
MKVLDDNKLVKYSNQYLIVVCMQNCNKKAWRMRLGTTLLVRDGKIELEQAGISASDSNEGVAPPFYFSTKRAFAKRRTAILDVEGLAGGPCRALDLALKMRYDITDRWSIGGGARMIEGGVDSDGVYNFGWFNMHFRLWVINIKGKRSHCLSSGRASRT